MTYVEPTKINVPLRLLDDVKENKLRCQLLAMSICIKCRYKDSLFRNVSIKAIQELLHCGFCTAKMLLTEAKKSSIFKYNATTNNLLAKNFKKKYTKKTTNRHGADIYTMYSVKVDIKNYTLRSLVKEFRKILFESPINAAERKDGFICNGKKKTTTSFIPNLPLTQKRQTKRIGAKSRMTTYRIAKELEAEKRISIERAKFKLVSVCSSDEAMNVESNGKNKTLVYDNLRGIVYSIVPNKYRIAERSETERFCHIIFNHSKRKGNFHAKNSVDAYYERMDH